MPATWREVSIALTPGLWLAPVPAAAQAMDPRAYARAPVNSTVAITGFAFCTGAIIRHGADFDSFSVGWQTAWVDRRMLKR